MIEWGKIKERVRPLFARLCKLDVSQVQWRDEAEASSWTKDPVVLLAIRDVPQFGTAEERYEYDAANDNQQVNVCAQKQFTLSVRVESFTQDISDPRFAGAVLENLKIRLERTSTIEAVQDLFALADWTDTTNVSYEDDDNRQVAAFVLDIFCLVADNDLDDSDGSGDTIQEVIVEGTVNTVDLDGPPPNVQIPVDLDVNAK